MLFGHINPDTTVCAFYIDGVKCIFRNEEHDELKDPLSFELEMIWEGIRLHLTSVARKTGQALYPNGGGINEQPDNFFEIINIIDRNSNEFVKHKLELEQKLKNKQPKK